MKIEQARQFPILDLVIILGGRYSNTDRKGHIWCFSPFRPLEKSPSFKIDQKKNKWHDFGMSRTIAHKYQGSGGDILDLWCDYNFKDRHNDIKEALAAFETLFKPQITGQAIPKQPNKLSVPNETPRYKIVRITNRISFDGLMRELERRRISLQLANQYLKQGHILDTVTGTKYTCFLFENDQGGYEVSIPNPSRNECFKTCIGVKASTRVMASDDKNSADVFEGFWDFLSWLSYKGVQNPINHSYILNSTSLVNETCEKIIAFKETVKYVFLFMDNDEAGFQATHAIAEKLEPEDFKFGSMAYFYDGYKDLSEFRQNGARPAFS